MPFTAGTWIYDDDHIQFKIVIGSNGEVLETLNAPKALQLKDFFDAEKWTLVT